jgi:hypothetical protein
MSAELVFSGGTTVTAPSADAQSLMLTLGRGLRGDRIQTPTGTVPLGFVDVETDVGVIYVNPGQVAYVRDTPVREPVLDQAG